MNKRMAQDANLIRSLKSGIAALALAAQALFPTHSEARDILPKLTYQEHFYTEYGSIARVMSNPDFKASLALWLGQENTAKSGIEKFLSTIDALLASGGSLSGSSEHQAYILQMKAHLGKVIRSNEFVEYIAYAIKTGQNENAATAFRFYYDELIHFYRELSEDPKFPAFHAPAKALLASHGSEAERRMVYELSNMLLDVSIAPGKPWDERIFSFDATKPNLVTASFGAASLLDGPIYTTFDSHVGPFQTISRSGFIDGNLVEYYDQTAYHTLGQEYVEFLEKRADLMVSYGYYDEASGKAKSVREFMNLLKQGERSFQEEGFDPVATHKAFDPSPENVFHQIHSAIREAKETIIVDIFFLGGSLGAALANLLIDRAEQGIKVYLIRDLWNHFGNRFEMLPVTNYLRAYSILNPGKMVVVPPFVKLHPAGIPEFLDHLLSDSVLKTLMAGSGVFNLDLIKDALILNPGGRSDHSKVFAIDGCANLPSSKFIVGSKNWTDRSGALAKDDIAVVSGPAACVLQDSYYHDLAEGLLNDDYTSFDRTAMEAGPYITSQFEALSNKAACADLSCKVKHILAPIDPLNRHTGQTPKQVEIADRGTAKLRLGMQNVDGTIISVQDQVVQAILSAKHQILFKNMMVFNKLIADAIVLAARRNPKLKVYLIMDSLVYEDKAQLDFNPNFLYLEQLYSVNTASKQRIHVRFHHPDYFSPLFRQEFHYKSLSVDGFSPDGRALSDTPFTIVGSANFDPITFSGAFRESQVEVHSSEMSAKYDRNFWNLWNKPNVKDAHLWDFALPPDLKHLDKKQTVGTVRNLIESAYMLQTMSR